MTASILSDIIYRDITKYSKSTEQHYLSGYYTGTEYSKSLQAANELVVTRMEKPQGDAFRMVKFCQLAPPGIPNNDDGYSLFKCRIIQNRKLPKSSTTNAAPQFWSSHQMIVKC